MYHIEPHHFSFYAIIALYSWINDRDTKYLIGIQYERSYGAYFLNFPTCAIGENSKSLERFMGNEEWVRNSELSSLWLVWGIDGLTNHDYVEAS